MPETSSIQSFRVKFPASCQPSGSFPGPHSSILSPLSPPALVSFLLPSLSPFLPPALPFSPSLSPPFPLFSFFPFFFFFHLFKEWSGYFQPSLSKCWRSRGSVWLGIVSLFCCVDPALWIPSVFQLSHQTQGSPGQGSSSPLRLGLPEQALCVLLRGHPQGRVAGGPVPPCSIGVLGQVCLG